MDGPEYSGAVVHRIAVEAPDRPALVGDGGACTYRALADRVNQASRALVARAEPAAARPPGVALLCANRAEFVEVIYACEQAGLCLTPINWHLGPDEIRYILEDCEASVFIADARFAEVAANVAATAEPAHRLAVGGAIDGFESYDRALDEQPSEPLPDPTLGTRMFYTSGTTGRPKGVVRELIPGTAEGLAALARMRGGEHVALVTGPLYHAAPLAINLQPPISAGCAVVLAERFDAEDTLRLIDAHKVSHVHMVPTMFHRLLALPADVRERYDVSSLRYVVHGAAPCPVHVKQAMIDWLGPIVHEYYAATEGGSVSISAAEWLEKPGSVGKPVAQAVEIRDADGRACGPDEVGTVFFERPDAGSFEYFKDPDKTATTYDGSGRWFTLGDQGYLDADGYLFLTGRTAEVIISGGVNIYPAEVDAVLLMHDAVADAAVVGVPHDEWGEEVKAVVELKAGHDPSDGLAEDLMAFCRDRLAHFKCPRSVDFVGELPRSPAGKVLRTRVRDGYRT
ncbi:MAG TPA: AMP-binding protein [Acidimicrobiia bacterium]|nr:AMP-binding protein [Acidimicrobiia bacterium]